MGTKLVDGVVVETTKEEDDAKAAQDSAEASILAALETAKTKIATDIASAKAKLKGLGLTDDEVNIILFRTHP